MHGLCLHAKEAADQKLFLCAELLVTKPNIKPVAVQSSSPMFPESPEAGQARFMETVKVCSEVFMANLLQMVAIAVQ
jgi:hypothetical protein